MCKTFNPYNRLLTNWNACTGSLENKHVFLENMWVISCYHEMLHHRDRNTRLSWIHQWLIHVYCMGELNYGHHDGIFLGCQSGWNLNLTTVHNRSQSNQLLASRFQPSVNSYSKYIYTISSWIAMTVIQWSDSQDNTYKQGLLTKIKWRHDYPESITINRTRRSIHSQGIHIIIISSILIAQWLSKQYIRLNMFFRPFTSVTFILSQSIRSTNHPHFNNSYSQYISHITYPTD